jgi:malonate transporter
VCSSARSRDNLDEWLDRFDIATAGLLPGESGLAIHVALISLHALILVSLATLLVELDLARAPRDDGSAPSSLGATLATTLRNTVVHR